MAYDRLAYKILRAHHGWNDSTEFFRVKGMNALAYINPLPLELCTEVTNTHLSTCSNDIHSETSIARSLDISMECFPGFCAALVDAAPMNSSN